MKIITFILLFKFVFVQCVPTGVILTTVQGKDSSNLTIYQPEEEAASCHISGILYKHGQQIERKNECDYCLCIDGDMFCYWQCVTTEELVTITSSTTSSTTNGSVVTNLISSTSVTGEVKNTSYDIANGITDNGTFTNAEKTVTEFQHIMVVNGTNDYEDFEEDDTTLPTYQTYEVSSKKLNESLCSIEGKMYGIGAVLPPEPGSCLECTCEADAKIICQPKNCATSEPKDDHQIQPDGESMMDMFDVDVF